MMIRERDRRGGRGAGHHQIGFFVILFVALFFLLNYYIVARVTFLLGLGMELSHWILVSFLSTIYMIGMGVTMRVNNAITRAITIFASVWMGVAVFSLFGLLILEIIYIFLELDHFISAVILILSIAGLSAYSGINAMIIRQNHIEIKNEKLDRELRVAHISDIHLGPVHGAGYLRRIVAMTRAMDPDLVLITGDLIDGPYHYPEEMLAPLREIECPIYLSTGNHEHIPGMEDNRGMLAGTGVHILRNSSAAFVIKAS